MSVNREGVIFKHWGTLVIIRSKSGAEMHEHIYYFCSPAVKQVSPECQEAMDTN